MSEETGKEGRLGREKSESEEDSSRAWRDGWKSEKGKGKDLVTAGKVQPRELGGEGVADS